MEERKPFKMEWADRRRMCKDEMDTLKMLMVALSELVKSANGLKKNLELIPDGMERMGGICDAMQELYEDILGTVSEAQLKHIKNVIHDCEIVLRNKAITNGAGNTVRMTVDEAKALVQAARFGGYCTECFMESPECETCSLFNVLSAVIPLDDYSGVLCPYNTAKWEV